MSFQEELRRTALGKTVEAPGKLDPAVLVAIPRAAARESLAVEIGKSLPFHGWDVWNCWEFCWLNQQRVPQAAMLELVVPCDTPNLFESKSLKLYLAGFALGCFAGEGAVLGQVTADLSAIAGGPVRARLISLDDPARLTPGLPEGDSLDDLGVPVPDAAPDPAWIQCGPARSGQRLFTNLFQSRCPVTAQPDYATVLIDAKGLFIEPEGLMRYLLGFRDHQAFHEQCAEKIYLDLSSRGVFESLDVVCRFSRRGGIDINPQRANAEVRPANLRMIRQ